MRRRVRAAKLRQQSARRTPMGIFGNRREESGTQRRSEEQNSRFEIAGLHLAEGANRLAPWIPPDDFGRLWSTRGDLRDPYFHRTWTALDGLDDLFLLAREEH